MRCSKSVATQGTPVWIGYSIFQVRSSLCIWILLISILFISNEKFGFRGLNRGRINNMIVCSDWFGKPSFVLVARYSLKFQRRAPPWGEKFFLSWRYCRLRHVKTGVDKYKDGEHIRKGINIMFSLTETSRYKYY